MAERGLPMVTIPADAYERLRMLALQLDGELNAVRLLAAEHTGSKRSLSRDLRTVLARADYWYDMWAQARTDYDAPAWRGPADNHGVWETRSGQ